MNAELQKRERGVAYYDEEDFKQQFEGLPPRAVAIVVMRAAMRILPFLAHRAIANAKAFTYWKPEDQALHALSIFRCCQTSFFINSLTRADKTSAEVKARSAATITTGVRAADAAAALTATTSRAAAMTMVDAVTAADAALSADASIAATYAARAVARAAGAHAAAAGIAIVADIARFKFAVKATHREIAALLGAPVWPEGIPPEFEVLHDQLLRDLQSLGVGFEVWVDWYEDRLNGKPIDWEIERQWALLTKEQLAQDPGEINSYLKGLRSGSLSKQLKRVRAIFIGSGEVGKTSLIRALHGEDVIEGTEAMTEGAAIKDSIHEQAGVFTRVTDFKEDDLTVHFWDFGGQVMAHATHQFFLRSKCLYVIVLAGRAERNPNEEAEYWLEHVRAFGDNAPVLLVGNKADVMPVSLDLRMLKQKFPNIIDFYSLSCTQAKDAYRAKFAIFSEEFKLRLNELAAQAQRFSPSQFKVLKSVEAKALNDDLLHEAQFDAICTAHGIAMEGPGGRDGLLDIFDKLGIVMHFAKMPLLTDYVLNPRWLTYGVYTIMYSAEARSAKGRLSDKNLVAMLKSANPSVAEGRIMRFPSERCRIIADAMIAFRLAYRLRTGELVVPALLASDEPEHDFKPKDFLAFRFDFGGFLPRHVLPALVVEYFQDIAKLNGGEIVWQSGVLLRPRRLEAEAFVRADYQTRSLNFLIKGSDGPTYLGMLRDNVLSSLETMPQLPFEEKVELRPDMRADSDGILGAPSVWISYGSILGAQKRRRETIDGPDGREYVLDRVLAAMPVSPDLRQADVFLSYSSKDGALVEKLDNELTGKRVSVWYDRGLIAGQPYREVLRKRIETVKAVVVLWTENSIGSKWVCAEADLADKHDKLICLRDPKLEPKRIPMPFAANDHIIAVGDMPGLIAALALKGAKPRI